MDLAGIGRYTARKWGKAQRDRYLKALDARIRWLAEAPLRGSRRNEIEAGVHSFPEGAHLIFYVIEGGGILVVGIPHQAMDIAAHLGTPGST